LNGFHNVAAVCSSISLLVLLGMLEANQCRSCGDQSAPVATVAESWRPNNGRSGQNRLAIRLMAEPIALVVAFCTLMPYFARQFG